MIDSIARALMPQKATLDEPQKAVVGPGAATMTWGTPLMEASRSAHQMMKDAQAVYARGNRWVKRAEMVISGRVGSVPWHLETLDGETVNDDSPPELVAIRDLFEKPLGDESVARTYTSQPKTRREMWGLTSRHMGICNVGFWYLDEINAASDWPQRIFFIRPDRMTPRDSGGRFIGWTLDKDSPNAQDLSLEEVLPFYLDPPDRGHFGTGLVESILGTIPLPNAIDHHAIDTLNSGGRLPGIYAPKEVQGDDVFDRLQADLRTIKDLPDSSKRDVVARAPIEFTPTAADMGSLVVTALSQTSRDDTLAHWGVPLSTIGGYTPAGMNSGETRKYDEAALWQNSVQFRVDALYETIQFQLLDRLKGVGIEVQLVIESPTFDDDTPKYELANKAVNLPLRNVERRALLGLDPFGDPNLDNAVVLPLNMVTYGQAPELDQMNDPGKARLDTALEAVRSSSVPRLKPAVAAVLKRMGRDIAAAIRDKGDQVAKKPSDYQTWMPASKRREWEAALAKAINPHLELAAETVGERVESQLGKSGKADPLFGGRIMARLLRNVGNRITGIMDTTRDDVRRLIERGLNEGMGAAQLGDLIESGAPFDEYRAELIARTETAQVLNEAALESYREFGVERVRAIDGDQDPECAARDGQVFDLDEALAIQDHPNGTLDWVPVLGTGKAAPIIVSEPVEANMGDGYIKLPSPIVHVAPADMTPIADAMKALAERPNPETVVHVAAPIVNVPEQPAPVVNFTPPEPPPQKASMEIQDVRVVSMPDRVVTARKVIQRDGKGLISSVDEKSVEETA